MAKSSRKAQAAKGLFDHVVPARGSTGRYFRFAACSPDRPRYSIPVGGGGCFMAGGGDGGVLPLTIHPRVWSTGEKYTPYLIIDVCGRSIWSTCQVVCTYMYSVHTEVGMVVVGTYTRVCTYWTVLTPAHVISMLAVVRQRKHPSTMGTHPKQPAFHLTSCRPDELGPVPVGCGFLRQVPDQLRGRALLT